VHSRTDGTVQREEEYKGGELRRIDGLRIEKAGKSDGTAD
jgi:hypothetical protein